LHRDERIGFWVGGDDKLVGSPSTRVHNLDGDGFRLPDMQDADQVVAVMMRLFSHLATPGYVVIFYPIAPRRRI
jgi:hypothetical protein